MKTAWLQNRPEDYKRLGLKPHEVEMWEDGKRDDDRPGYTEWWYFDALMDDGTSVVVHFNTKTSGKALVKNGPSPAVVISIMPPSGEEYTDTLLYPASEASFSKEKCDVKFGPHRICGDLKDYTIQVEPVNGIGCDLKLHNERKSWRPETGHLSFGSNDKYFTWLFVVPKGEISGTITYGGKTVTVHGSGYHDHQWGTMNPANFNNWLWGRQHFEDYTILMFDVITNKKYGYEHLPIFCVQDKDGNVVFENTSCDKGFSCEVISEYKENQIGKSFPEEIVYHYAHDGKSIEHRIGIHYPILKQDIYHESSKMMQKVMDFMKINPAYVRYKAVGTMCMTENVKQVERTGDWIYEFANMTSSYREQMSAHK